MAYEVEGTVKVIFDTQTFPSGFSKREFVVTTKDRYPQDIKLECIKERIELLNSCAPGDTVNVTFDLRGNEYNDRYYVNLQAWKIEKQASGGEETGGDVPPPSDEHAPAEEEDEDNVPF